VQTYSRNAPLVNQSREKCSGTRVTQFAEVMRFVYRDRVLQRSERRAEPESQAYLLAS